MKDIQMQIEKTLESIDNIEKINAPSFFETRLIARMEKQLLPSNINWLQFNKPVWVIASLTILLLINIYLIGYSKTETIAKHNHLQPSNLESFANDYHLNTHSSEY